MSEALKQVIDFKRSLIKNFLFQCTPEQIDLFNRMYGSVEEAPEDKLDLAIWQCERTVEKNKIKSAS